MRDRILKTWFSFQFYAVCLSYFIFSKEKWIRETLSHVFVVHFNSELRGEHKGSIHRAQVQTISLFWLCSVKSLHRDIQASVASIITRIPSMDFFEWRGKYTEYLFLLPLLQTQKPILKIIFLYFWVIKTVLLCIINCFEAPGTNLLITWSNVLCSIRKAKLLTRQGPVSGTLVELLWSL